MPASRSCVSPFEIMPITVLLSDDKEVIRSLIRPLLNSDPEIELVGEAVTFEQTIQNVIDLRPQIIVMDMHRPDPAPVRPKEIKSLLQSLGSQLIAISCQNDKSSEARAESLGAAILLDKAVLATELIAVIRGAGTMNNCPAHR
jgi:DNA-binding NarL/FixJ family response regulator